MITLKDVSLGFASPAGTGINCSENGEEFPPRVVLKQQQEMIHP